MPLKMFTSTSLTILSVLAGSLFYYGYLTLTSPLSRVPNAFILAPFSRLWLLWLKFNNKSDRTICEAHRKLGPVVRIGPNEISIACIENGVSTVYGGNYNKSTFYSGFGNFGHPIMFSMLTTRPRAERKKLMAALYTNSYVQSSAELTKIMERVIHQGVLPSIERCIRINQSLEVHVETKAYSTDVASAYLFGIENGTRLLQDEKDKQTYCKAFLIDLNGFFWLTEAPSVAAILHKFNWRTSSEDQDPFSKIESLIESLCDSAKKSSALQTPDRPTVYSSLYRGLEIAGTSPDTIDHVVAAELMDHILASHEIMGIAMTYIMWQLSKNPAWQSRLREKLKTLDPGSINSQEALPILDAVITETFRLHPPSVGQFPRVVPAGGAQIGPYYDIPAKTVVSACISALLTNEDVFPNPQEWHPERWLVSDGERKKTMNRWMWNFGVGARMCIGNHLAMRTIKTFLFYIYRDYKTKIDGNPNMDQIDSIFPRPIGGELYLKFEKA